MSTGPALLLYTCLLFVAVSADGQIFGSGNGSGSSGGCLGRGRTWHSGPCAERGAADAPRSRRLLAWRARDAAHGLFVGSNATAVVPQQSLPHADSPLPAPGLLTARGSGSWLPQQWLSAPSPMHTEGAAAAVEVRTAPELAMRRWLASAAPPLGVPQASPAVAPGPQGELPAYLLIVVQVMPADRPMPQLRSSFLRYHGSAHFTLRRALHIGAPAWLKALYMSHHMSHPRPKRHLYCHA